MASPSHASYGNDHAAFPGWSLDVLMRRPDSRQRESFCDVEPFPSGVQGLVNRTSSHELCVGWKIVAAEEEHTDVLEQKWPEWDGRIVRIRRICCDRSVDCEYLEVGCDVGCERHFDDVVDAFWREGLQTRDRVAADEHDMMCPGTACGCFV